MMLYNYGSRSVRTRWLIFVALVVVVLPLAFVRADPPASPPPCDVVLDRVFCARMTWIEADTADPEGDRFFFQGELVNWTSKDAFGFVLVLNQGGIVMGGDQPPYFCGAFLDSDGRPLDGVQVFPRPPAGCIPPLPNLDFNDLNDRSARVVGAGIPNDWTVLRSSLTRIEFSSLGGTSIPAPTSSAINGVVYRGLLDPQFNGSPQADCQLALTQMIPGSIVVGSNPATIQIPDRETIDDGPNARDGFTIVIDDFDPGEEFSIDWWIIGSDGRPIGQRSMDGNAVEGDDYGFGTFNTFRFPNTVGPAPTPTPLWDTDSSGQGRVNAGYDPVDSMTNDLPVNFAEEEDPMTGVEGYQINPVLPTFPGAGEQFAIEQGAAITAPPHIAGQGMGGTNMSGPRTVPIPTTGGGGIPLLDGWKLFVLPLLLALVAMRMLASRKA